MFRKLMLGLLALGIVGGSTAGFASNADAHPYRRYNYRYDYERYYGYRNCGCGNRPVYGYRYRPYYGYGSRYYTTTYYGNFYYNY